MKDSYLVGSLGVGQNALSQGDDARIWLDVEEGGGRVVANDGHCHLVERSLQHRRGTA